MTNSPHAWSSYALDASNLINPQPGDVSIVSLEATTDGTVTFEVAVKDVPIGPSATAERLATVFEVQGSPSLRGRPFLPNNVNVTLSVSATGRLLVVATPKAAQRTFFFRVRLHADDDGWPLAPRGMVQLWAGGPYWAETNIGAEKPWDSGYHFWWGDIIGYKWENGQFVASDGSSSSFSFAEENVPTYRKSIDTLRSEGWIVSQNGTDVLAPEHDAAQVQWGGEWRMPTKQELSDLHSKCTWTLATTNGVKGYIVCGRGNYASASIFLPWAGYGMGTSLGNSDSCGYFWSSVPASGSSLYSWYYYFNSSYRSTFDGRRFTGNSIRPVLSFAE